MLKMLHCNDPYNEDAAAQLFKVAFDENSVIETQSTIIILFAKIGV